MGLLKSAKKRLQWLLNVKFDQGTGFCRYSRYGKNIYIRHPRHFLTESKNSWLCESIFFKHYLPGNEDVVVDLGAGYGEEAVWLSQHAPEARYYGMETQPVIFECLSNTYHGLGNSFCAFPYAITDATGFKTQSQFSYASSSQQREGYIHVPVLTWKEFCEQYKITKIDLLKMNIEGAEREFINSVHDFPAILRMIISCHDFRANRGDGEHFRTKKTVVEKLQQNGYQIKTFSYGKNWSEDWIYAERI
jgi:FkbM family methyltransferase